MQMPAVKTRVIEIDDEGVVSGREGFVTAVLTAPYVKVMLNDGTDEVMNALDLHWTR